MSVRARGIVLCVGEPLIALTPEVGRSLESADAFTVAEGGAELNVAIHLARLGVPVRFAGRVGDDPLGRRLRHALGREGVDVSTLALDETLPTGLYLKEPGEEGTAVHYFRRGSAASVVDRLPDGALVDVGHVHVTGILAALSDACRKLVQDLLAHPRPTAVSFDVNYRHALWEADVAGPVLMDLARRADVVFVGLDEARELWGADNHQAVRALLPEPAEVVVKDGRRPAVAYVGGEPRVVEPALTVDVIEPVGAGDAFAAGYLATRRDGRDVRSALRVGHALAAGVLRSNSDHGVPPDLGLLAAARSGRQSSPESHPTAARPAKGHPDDGATGGQEDDDTWA